MPCAQSRETVKRSEFAGHAGYGYCRSHSRWFWTFGSTCSARRTGCRSAGSLPPANIGERVVATEILDRVSVAGHIGLRLLALAAGIWHNHLTGQPARAFAAYGR